MAAADPYIFLEAVCWLEQRLADGLPVSNEVLQQEATEEGITLPALPGQKGARGAECPQRGPVGLALTATHDCALSHAISHTRHTSVRLDPLGIKQIKQLLWRHPRHTVPLRWRSSPILWKPARRGRRPGERG